MLSACFLRRSQCFAAVLQHGCCRSPVVVPCSSSSSSSSSRRAPHGHSRGARSAARRSLSTSTRMQVVPGAHVDGSGSGATTQHHQQQLHHHSSHQHGQHSVQLVTSEFLSADDLPPGTHLHLIVLNYVLPQQTAALWRRATTRICADGGANRLYDQIAAMLPGLDPDAARAAFLPDLIKGDLDSVRPDVQEFYTSHGVPMIDLSSDQETTDLEKCLLFLEGRLRSMSQQQQQHADGHGQQGQQQQQQAGAAAAAGARGMTLVAAAPAARQAAGAVAAAGVSRGGLGHTAKAIGAANAARAASGAGTHSSSHRSSACAAASSSIEGGSAAAEPEQQPASPQQQQQQQAAARPIMGELLFLQEQQPAAAAAGQPAASAIDMSVEAAETAGPLQLGGSGAAAASSTPTASSQQQQGRLSRLAESWVPDSSCASGEAGAAAAGVHASVLQAAEPPAKRVHQEHVILVLGALGGRLDHTLSNLNTLYCYRHLDMALWGDGNLVRLLRAGHAVISPARSEGPTCGLVPLAQPATASSSGLKWDLNHTHMCFRGLLSTSNVIASDRVEVVTDEDLLWITTVADAAGAAAAPAAAG